MPKVSRIPSLPGRKKIGLGGEKREDMYSPFSNNDEMIVMSSRVTKSSLRESGKKVLVLRSRTPRINLD